MNFFAGCQPAILTMSFRSISWCFRQSKKMRPIPDLNKRLVAPAVCSSRPTVPNWPIAVQRGQAERANWEQKERRVRWEPPPPWGAASPPPPPPPLPPPPPPRAHTFPCGRGRRRWGEGGGVGWGLQVPAVKCRPRAGDADAFVINFAYKGKAADSLRPTVRVRRTPCTRARAHTHTHTHRCTHASTHRRTFSPLAPSAPRPLC